MSPFFNPASAAGTAGLHFHQLNFTALVPSSGAHADALVQYGSDAGVEALAVPLDREEHRAVGAFRLLHDDVFPGRIGLAIQLDDAVAIHQAGFGRR